jgi:hypothetical protein
MNLYFIVEGVTESIVYPDWLSHLLPDLHRIKVASKVQSNNYYLITGGGYPSIYNILDTAIEEINSTKKYNYLIVCLDAEENGIDYLLQEVQDNIRTILTDKNIDLENTKLKIIIQNKCIETWFLGNSKIYSRQPQSQALLNYTRYYNVSIDCPELMGDNGFNTHAQFHGAYLKELLTEKSIMYSKTMPREVRKKYYLNELQSRICGPSNHLPSFQNFIAFCDLVRSQL